MAVEKSYPRSITYGLTKNDKPDFNRLVGSDLTLFIEQNQSMHIHALPGMETLYEQIINTHNMVILTDTNGLVMLRWAMTIFWKRPIGARSSPASSGPNKARARTQSELQS